MSGQICDGVQKIKVHKTCEFVFWRPPWGGDKKSTKICLWKETPGDRQRSSPFLYVILWIFTTECGFQPNITFRTITTPCQQWNDRKAWVWRLVEKQSAYFVALLQNSSVESHSSGRREGCSWIRISVWSLSNSIKLYQLLTSLGTSDDKWWAMRRNEWNEKQGKLEKKDSSSYCLTQIPRWLAYCISAIRKLNISGFKLCFQNMIPLFKSPR